MLRPLYSLVLIGAQPLLRRKLRRRGVAEPGYLEHVEERFGRYAAASAPGRLWIHAVSLGETRAAAVDELLHRLVRLNSRRAAEEAAGTVRWLRPEFQAGAPAGVRLAGWRSSTGARCVELAQPAISSTAASAARIAGRRGSVIVELDVLIQCRILGGRSERHPAAA